jgi:hypothetical protein
MWTPRGCSERRIVDWHPIPALTIDEKEQPCSPVQMAATAERCQYWQTDNEMGASYALAFMAHLAEGGVAGYQAIFQLDDADWGGSEEFPHDWGLRTNKDNHGLRKAIYHAQTIVGRMPRSLVSVSAAHANGADEYFPHVYAMAGAEGDRLSVLLWSYVTSPGRQAVEVLRDMGYGPADFARWGGQTRIAAFLTGAIAVSALTSLASAQPAQAASAVGRRSAQARRHRRGDDEPADRPGRAWPAPHPHHQRRRRPRRAHCPAGSKCRVGGRRR